MATGKPNLKELLQSAQLPALPQSAIRLLELSKNADNGPVQYAVPIEADPGLTGQVLKFVNSSYFGFSREISNVKLAITLVGVRTIKNFSLWSAVFSIMPNPRCGPFDLKSLWQDSLRRGLFARAVGKELGVKEAEDLFAAALLQDMAIPLLAKELPQEYQELLESRKDGNKRLSLLEREAFGWTHADAAAYMARSWKLPDEFATLIETHTEIDSLLATEPKNLAKISVALAAVLPSASNSQWMERERFLAIYRTLTNDKGQSVDELFAKTDKEFADFAPILKIASPAKSLVQCLEEAPVAAQ
jgi:HD-like signal output (HDOD) protein